jgi:GAF domain-containing protein
MADQHVSTELESLLIEARTVREHLDDFTLRAGHHLGRGTHCSISLRHAGEDRLAASSGPRPASCDEVEFREGAGPCVTAMDDLQVVLVPDLHDDDRWGPWNEQARAVGFRSSAAVPANVGEGADIALNLYSDLVDPWDRDALIQADTFAQDIARTVGLCLQVARMAQQVEDLRAAVAARDVINQAVGVVMVTNRCTVEEALVILRSASVHRNVDMVEVASSIVEGLTGAEARPLTGLDGAPDRDA